MFAWQTCMRTTNRLCRTEPATVKARDRVARRPRRDATPSTTLGDVKTGTSGGTGDPAQRTERKSSEFVQSLDRGLAVIRAFGPGRDRLTLSEVARETGLTRAAARRFLLTLVSLGYVRTNGKEFSLGPRVLELGYSYLSSLSLPEVATPHVEALVAEVRESSSISVLDGEDVVDIVRVPAKRIMTVSVPVGTRFRAHASSKGRVLLAHLSEQELNVFLEDAGLEQLTDRTVTDPAQLRVLLDEVRTKGYALVDQEVEEGVRSVAVPIRDAGGTVIAAINVSSYASRVSTGAVRQEVLPRLLATASQIEADLRAQGTQRS
jgi:IclR family transcriptional regulator, pca regulon regulatory protein